jgi:SHS2 domain-containing protein
MTPARLTPFEHDADEGFEAEAGSLAEIWDLSARGLLTVMTDPAAVGREVRAWVEVDAGDRAELLVESLGELLYRFEVEGLLTAGVDHFELTETADGVRARFRVLGETHDPDRHPTGAGVKAVTHHGAALERTGDVWRARILLDL